MFLRALKIVLGVSSTIEASVCVCVCVCWL